MGEQEHCYQPARSCSHDVYYWKSESGRLGGVQTDAQGMGWGSHLCQQLHAFTIFSFHLPSSPVLVQLAAELSFLSLIGYIPGTVLLTVQLQLNYSVFCQAGLRENSFPSIVFAVPARLQFSCSVITCLELGVLRRELEGQWQPPKLLYNPLLPGNSQEIFHRTAPFQN